MGITDIDRRILALGIARMADSLGNSFLIVVLPLYITSGVVSGGTFGLAPALITGIILSAYGFFNSALQPFVGKLSDRTGKRRIFVVVGLLVLTVANFAYSLVDSYTAILLVRLGQGLGVAIGPLSAGYLSSIELPVGQPYATPFVFGALLALVGFVLVYTQVEETVQANTAPNAGPSPSSSD